VSDQENPFAPNDRNHEEPEKPKRDQFESDREFRGFSGYQQQQQPPPGSSGQPPPYGQPFQPGGSPFGTPPGYTGYAPYATGPSLPWYEVWKRAIMQPNLHNYIQLISDPSGNFLRGLMFILAGTLLSTVIGIPSQIITNLALEDDQFFGPYQFYTPETNIFFTLVCGIPFAILITTIVYAIYVAITHVAALVLGGQGSIDKLGYGLSLYVAPLSIINALISLVLTPLALIATPLFVLANLASFGLGLVILVYGIVLSVIATKAVHQFGWPQATIAALATLILYFGCVFACLFFIFASVLAS
jgi:hypothetical protein